jgi:hypothetical protein
MNPGIPLPPQPIVTRWGTWLNAAIYYAENLSFIERVVESLDKEDSVAIAEAQEVLASNTIRREVAYICANFKSIPSSIEKLESKNINLTESLRIIESLKVHLESCEGVVAIAVLEKLNRILAKNPGYEAMQRI